MIAVVIDRVKAVVAWRAVVRAVVITLGLGLNQASRGELGLGSGYRYRR